MPETKEVKKAKGDRTKPKKARNLIPKQDVQADVVSMGGGTLTSKPPLYSHDGKYFFCACSRYVKVFSVASGECVRTLVGHTDDVTFLAHNPSNALQLISCSLDGTIRVWDYNDSVQLRHHDLQIPLHYVALHPALPPNTALVVSTVTNLKKGVLKNASRVYIYRLKPGKGTKKTTLFKGGECVAAAISPDGLRFAMVAKKKLYLCDIKAATVEKFGHTHKLLALAFHPKEPCIATGDATGKVTLWYCIGGERPAVTTTMHWHSHAVASIAYSGDGAYLLSGGHESVLVIWQLATDNKQFLPRLGGPIRHICISADEEHFLLAHGDNAIRIVSSASLEIEHMIKGFRRAEGVSDRLPPTGLVVQPNTGLIVTNGLPGTLQFYDPRADRHVTEAEIIPRNYVSRRNNAPINYAHVERAAFSADGAWMATIERREAGILSEESRMKFWRVSPDSSTRAPYTLTTCCDAPHSKRVEALVFHPRVHMAVTCGLDRRFKIWEKTSDSSSSWFCRSVGFYQGLPAHAAAFSEDGSLVAVAFGSTVTLWDPVSNSLQGVLSYPPSNEKVSFVAFIAASPFLVASTETTVYVWNILTCSVWWSYRMNATSIAVDPSSPRFAAFVKDDQTGDYRAVLFEAATPTPISILPLAGHRVWSAVFVPPRRADGNGEHADSLVCFFNDRFEVGTFDAAALALRADAAAFPADRAPLQAMARLSTVDADEEESRAVFAQVFGGASSQTAKGQRASAQAVEKSDVAVSAVGFEPAPVGDQRLSRTIFNAPSHVIPPASQLFTSFMDLLLVKAAPVSENGTAKTPVHAADDNRMEVDTPSTASAAALNVPTHSGHKTHPHDDVDSNINLAVYDDFVDFFKAELNISRGSAAAAAAPAKGSLPRQKQAKQAPSNGSQSHSQESTPASDNKDAQAQEKDVRGAQGVRFANATPAQTPTQKNGPARKTPARKRKAEEDESDASETSHVDEDGSALPLPKKKAHQRTPSNKQGRAAEIDDSDADAEAPKHGKSASSTPTAATTNGHSVQKSLRKRVLADSDADTDVHVTPMRTPNARKGGATDTPLTQSAKTKSKSPATDPSPELIKALRNRIVKTPKKK